MTTMTAPDNLAAHLAAMLAEMDDLGEAIDGTIECYGDTYAEHRGETARFGDSWPGAQIQLANMNNGITSMEAEYAAMQAVLDHVHPIVGPPAPPAPPTPEEPF